VRRGWVLVVGVLLVGVTPGLVGLAPGVAAAATERCASAGPGQLVVERYLAAHREYGRVKVDGRQSVADCTAIGRFQRRFGIAPAEGYAGTTTKDVAQRLGRAALGRCGTGTRVCVDLSSQTFWMVRSGKVVLGPTTLRSGRAGKRTPTGTFRIGTKKRMTTSSYYGTKMPYWQQFNRDIGFHETPSYLYTGPGSHGCVNLLRRDAIALYDLTARGTTVTVLGRKPGT
jgi:hypothetical protein